MKYVTMTVGGSKGSTFDASNDDEAEAMATAAGYKVLDITDQAFEPELILVVAE